MRASAAKKNHAGSTSINRDLPFTISPIYAKIDLLDKSVCYQWVKTESVAGIVSAVFVAVDES